MNIIIYYILIYIYIISSISRRKNVGSTAAPSATITISTYGGVLKWYPWESSAKNLRRPRCWPREAPWFPLCYAPRPGCHDLWKDPKDARTHQKWGFFPEC